MGKSRYIKNNTELAINLKSAREQANLTQSEVSKIIGMERSAVSYYETGKTLPSIFILIKLSKLYNIDIKRFISIPLY